jgi:hypothetical protein
MAKKKDAEAVPETAVPAEKVTQRVAVQRALAADKDSPADGVAYVKEQFDITLNNGVLDGQEPAQEGRGDDRQEARPHGRVGELSSGAKAGQQARKQLGQVGACRQRPGGPARGRSDQGYSNSSTCRVAMKRS